MKFDKDEFMKMVLAFCEQHDTDPILTIKFLQGVCERKDIKNIIPFCKGCLERISDEEIAQLTIQKKYFDGIKFNGFDDDELNRTLLVLIENHCIKEFPITYEELDELNKQVASYCREKGYATYKQAVALILKSKLLKQCNIPLEMLQKQAQEQVDEWKQLIEDIQHGND